MWRPNYEVFKHYEDRPPSKGNNRSNIEKERLGEFYTSLNSFIHYNGQIRKPKNKKIGRFPIYKLIQNNSKVNIYRKSANLSEFCDHYNIRKGGSTRIVGYMPDHVGFERTKLVINDNIFLNYFIDNSSIIKKSCSDNFYSEFIKSAGQPRVVYDKGFEPTSLHISSFCDESGLNAKYDFETIVNILSKSEFKWFNSPHVKFFGIEELWGTTRVKDSAFSGHYTSKIAGRTKEAANLVCRKAASHIFEQLKTEPVKNCYLWSLLSREKDNKLVNNAGEASQIGTRTVMCTEHPMSLLLTMFAQRIQCALNTVEPDKINYHVTGKFDGDKYVRLKELERNFDFKVEADWRSYDSNIDSVFIKVACMILLQNLPDDRLHRNIRYLITSSHVTKYIALPPGVVVEVNKGVPSGTPFTTLINCTINLIYWCLIGERIYGDDYINNMYVEVYGDDAIVYFKYSDKLSEIDNIIADLGLKSEPIYNNLKFCNYNYQQKEDVDFLKRRFTDSKLNWNHKKLFDKLFYQSHKRNFKEQLELLLSFYETSPDDEDLKWLLKDVLRWFRTKYPFHNIGERLSQLYNPYEFERRHVDLVFEYSPGNNKTTVDSYVNTYLNLYSKYGIYHKYWSYYEESEWDEWRTEQTLMLLAMNVDFNRSFARLRKIRKFLQRVKGEDWNAFSLTAERDENMTNYKKYCISGITSYFERFNKREERVSNQDDDYSISTW